MPKNRVVAAAEPANVVIKNSNNHEFSYRKRMTSPSEWRRQLRPQNSNYIQCGNAEYVSLVLSDSRRNLEPHNTKRSPTCHDEVYASLASSVRSRAIQYFFLLVTTLFGE